MPFEIIGEIFRQVHKSDDREATGDLMIEVHDASIPGLLCLVCHRWKAIAIATPTLWSNITIRVVQYAGGSAALVKATHVHGIWTWIDRVSPSPWTLRIRMTRESMYTYSSHVGGVPLFQLLDKPESLHLKRLTIIGMGDLCTLEMTELTFPGVTSLVTNYWNIGANHQPGVSGLPSLPSMTQANLTNFRKLGDQFTFPSSPSNAVLWSQLTDLYLSATGGSMILYRWWRAVFKHCVALKRGCFGIDSHSGDATFTEPAAAIFPHLTELAFLKLAPFHEPWHGISLPSLTKLRVFGEYPDRPQFYGMDSSNPRLFSNLKHLTLVSRSGMPDSSLLRILGNLPQLTELFFSRTLSPGFREVLEFLTYDHDGRFDLRQLEALGIIVPLPNYRRGWQGVPNDFPLFPLDACAASAASRTRTVENGQFTRVPPTLTPLKHFVLRISIGMMAHELIDRLREALVPLTSYGLKASLFPAWPGQGSRGAKHLGGRYPVPPSGHIDMKHLDEGFLDFIDVDEYSLYPADNLYR